MTKTDTTILEEKRRCGFTRGLGLVGSTFKGELLDKLCHGLGLAENSRAALYKRINGVSPLTPLEVTFVEQCFTEAMVPADCIWDLQN